MTGDPREKRDGALQFSSLFFSFFSGSAFQSNRFEIDKRKLEGRRSLKVSQFIKHNQLNMLTMNTHMGSPLPLAVALLFVLPAHDISLHPSPISFSSISFLPTREDSIYHFTTLLKRARGASIYCLSPSLLWGQIQLIKFWLEKPLEILF